MLALPRKTDYALIALSYLAERPQRVASAREIAEAHNVPCSLLMNVMKDLHAGGLVSSTRGAKGGYQLSADLQATSLYDVLTLTNGEPQLTQCCQNLSSAGPLEGQSVCQVSDGCPVRQPLRALHLRLARFLKEVKLADLLVPGRRIDVPVEMVGIC